MDNFTHLHVHTEYSFLDGYNRIDNMMKKVKELGMDSIAITDHGTLAGVYAFHQKCKENGIKPIIGCEMYYTEDSSIISADKKERDAIAWDKFLKDYESSPDNLSLGEDFDITKIKATKKKEIIKEYGYDTKGYHIILLAKNQNGWKNLCKLVSDSFEKGMFNGRPHCDLKILEQYKEDIICTTACMSSYLNVLILKDNILKAKEHLEKLIGIFGKENLFLEIQPLNDEKQVKINKAVIKFAEEYGLRLVATNDVHYTYEEDSFEHDVLLCIGTGKLVADENRMRYAKEFWIRSYDEMYNAFKRTLVEDEYDDIIKTALSNTNVIKDMVEDNVKLKSDKPLLPKVDVPGGIDDSIYLNQLCWKKLYRYLNKEGLKDKTEIYEKRLNHEMNVIRTKGFSSYILTVMDAIKQSSFGPGRGSGAGSLVLFLLGIVKGTDPVEYDLLFSRFLTMDRTSPPDIDSDVSKDKRQELIRYLNDKYGIDSTSQVGTITVLGVKSGIKDVARVFGIPPTESNTITKRIDDIYNEIDLSFKVLDSLEESNPDAYKKFKELENEYQQIFTIARHFEGIPRNMGVHAGGVLITPGHVNDYFPTKIVEGKKVTMWDKNIVEEAGGIKFDYLGLKTISVIEKCLEFIKDSTGQEITLNDLYKSKDILDDEGVYDMICQTKTDAVFQMESKLFKGLIQRIQPRNIRDLIAITSMARPGPLSAEMDKKYVDNKEGEITYPIRGVEDILKETYGTILYQEQIMLIAKKIAGFDDNQADTYLRKALAKKKRKIMDLCKEWLIYGKPKQDEYGAPIKGAINNGYTENELLNFWHDLEGYASYLFNKSHATSYSLLTVITAYLKYHYPTEYYAAVLTYEEKEESRRNHVDAAREDFDIEVVIPSINNAHKEFYPNPDDRLIYYGLGSVKSVGEASIPDLIDNAPYENLEDITGRLPKSKFGKKAAEALILSGFFDFEDSNRHALLNRYYDISKNKKAERFNEDITKLDIIAHETKYLSMPFSVRTWFGQLKNGDKIADRALIITNVNERVDRKGKIMAFITAKDTVGEEENLELIVFSSTYSRSVDAFDINLGNKIIINGKKDEGKIIVNKAKKANSWN